MKNLEDDKFDTNEKIENFKNNLNFKDRLDFNTAIHSNLRVMARKMKLLNYSNELIAEVTQLPLKEIEKL